MRKTLLLSLMVGALPFLSIAKEGPSVPEGMKQLHFLENKGQVHDQNNNPRNDIQFSVGSNGLTAFIGDGQIHYQFSRLLNGHKLSTPSKQSHRNVPGEKPQLEMYRMDVELIGANKDAVVIKEQEQSFTTNFFKRHFVERNSKGISDYELTAHSYDKIVYKDVYPNIDWVLFVKNDQLEYEFIVNPGGNPANIKLKYNGVTSLGKNEDGSLTAVTPLGTVTEKAPYSFQADGKVVSSSFKVTGDVVSFFVGDYTGTLTIDPILTWGSYFGDVGTDEYKSVLYDGTGNVYMIGYTGSVNNIATLGAYQQLNAGDFDLMISKISSTGGLVWSTFFGTLGEEVGWAGHWNGADLIVCGSTTVFGDLDGYFVQLSSTGTTSNFDIAYGDLGEEIAFSMCRDAGNNIYLGVRTTGQNMIATVGQTTFGGGTYDGIILKTDMTGTALWATFLGGTGDDAIVGMSCNSANEIYVGGWTSSSNAITTPGVSQQVWGGGYDGFLARYNTSGNKLFGTYWGGPADENILAVATDNSGGVYVTGIGSSTGLATLGAFQSSMNGVSDVLVGKYNNAGTIQWGTYYGGTAYESGFGIKVDNSGGVFVAGYTESTANIASGGFDNTFSGTGDGFISKFSNSGSLAWGSYYGGSGYDQMNGVEPDNAGSVYVAGYTESAADIAVNTTLQTTYEGLGDGVVAKIADCTLPATPGTITGSASVCAGSSQTYSVAAVTGATSYTWTLPGGWTGTSTTNSISVTVGTTGGTISVTADNSCGSSTAQTLSVTVNPIPTATITPAGPTTFCDGNSVVLNANTGTGYTYAWFEGTNPVGTGTSSYTATTSGSYTVEVTANGCSATSSAVTVTVNPTPNATASSNSVICVGQQLDLMGNSTTVGATYSWAGPSTFTSGLQNPSIPNAQPVNAGVYTLTVTANGCSQTANTTVVVAAGAPAAPASINGDISICENSTGNVYDVTSDPNATNYNWTLPTGWSGTSTTNSITATAGAAGSVTIEVTAENGCGVSAPTTLNVTVNPLPTATITQSVNTLTVTGTFATYQWYDGSGPIAGATSQSYTATGDGSYYCIVTDANGCSATSNTINLVLGVNTVATQSTVSLYPNPNNGSFAIEGAFTSNEGKVHVAIVDVAGRIVHQEQVSVSNNKLSVRIDMNNGLSTGVYTIKLSSDAANAVIPFVKK